MIGIVGNPNCGKTCLFNALTGANQRVGNWPGVTVERKEGEYVYNGTKITLVDLPGVYSLDAEDGETGLDELVARDYLLSAEANLIVNIIDASNLERNLYLTTQVMEMGVPIILALNMMDLARDQGLRIDVDALADRLGCPVIPISAIRKEGLPQLLEAMSQGLQQPPRPKSYVAYPPVMEEAIAAVVALLQEKNPDAAIDRRWKAVQLLEYEDRVAPEIQSPELDRIVVKHRRKIHQVLSEDIDIIVADSRYGSIHKLLQGAAEREGEVSVKLSDKIDRILLNRWLGIPIFAFIMYLMFLISINLSSVFIDFFDILAQTIFVDGFGHLLRTVGTPEWLVVLLADGAGGGVQTVATFIPVIGLMFLCLSFLEDSGYMARAAFMMDRLMRMIGLPGKSFVAMIVGFGCNVPALMSTRTLEHPRDRLMSIVMTPFMSCTARLPVYAIFAAAFFPIGGQNVVFGLYLIGILAAVFTGLVLKNTLLPGKPTPFVMELPTYHLPSVKSMLLRTWDRLQGFIIRAGQVILLMVMVLGLLNSVGTDGSFGNQSNSKSVLVATSQAITPILRPMGIQQDNWPATVGIFTGIFAKEATVGTLDSMYSQLAQTSQTSQTSESGLLEETRFLSRIGEAFATIPANLATIPGALLDPLGLSAVDDASGENTANAASGLGRGAFGQMAMRFQTSAAAFAYMLFILLYCPCVAAVATVYRETNLGWTMFVIGWTTGLAYWSATLFYQVATFAQHPISSLAWILGLLTAMGGTFLVMKNVRSRSSATSRSQNN
ncbi:MULTISPECIES: Fe(2+) transporter permease subunit FeoB [Planktothricoides]|uniref:Fe(2+) transporter permease subunit FeoB n=1 Tax=Planktothricoides TaxID=132607 RepID=UPI0006C500F2|nr:iron transporter FeoB [Planktothricoides sp. SR001]